MGLTEPATAPTTAPYGQRSRICAAGWLTIPAIGGTEMGATGPLGPVEQLEPNAGGLDA